MDLISLSEIFIYSLKNPRKHFKFALLRTKKPTAGRVITDRFKKKTKPNPTKTTTQTKPQPTKSSFHNYPRHKQQLSPFSFMDEWLNWFWKSAVQELIEDSFQFTLQKLSAFLIITALTDLFFPCHFLPQPGKFCSLIKSHILLLSS